MSKSNVYTRTGDHGETSLVGGGQASRVALVVKNPLANASAARLPTQEA